MKSLLLIIALLVTAQFTSAQSLNTFSNPEKTVSIDLPADWHLQHNKEDRVMQMFISLEELVSDTTLFEIGATISKVEQVSKSYPSLITDHKIVIEWYTAYKRNGYDYIEFEEVDLQEVTIGEYKGLRSELIFRKNQFSKKIHLLQFVLAHDNNLLSVSLESPTKTWDDYKDTFEKAIASMKLQ